MKKVALSLAGVLAAVAFAPEASAVPAFARQTGMACNACHFQHFPLLNGFGRSFKSSGFTLIGAEGKVEGDNLSIPNVVNAAILTSMGYEKTNATAAFGQPFNATSASGGSTGAFFVGAFNGEASLFVGGRGSDFMGFLGEVTLGGGAAAMDSLKTPILYDVGNGMRGGIVFFTTNGQGASYGFETLNTGANAIHTITNTVGFNGQYINAVSAQQYVGTATHATGAAVVVNSDMGFVNITKWAEVGPDTLAGGGPAGTGTGFATLGSTYARVAYTFDAAGWDMGVGGQYWGGTSASADLGTTATTKATALDFQMQGSAGAMPLGVYVTWATAPNDTANTNVFNTGTANRTSFNVAAELGVMPEKATVGAAVRYAKSGQAGVTNGSSNMTDNALYLTATYKLAQNLLSRLSYVHEFGNFWTDNGNANEQLFGTNSWTVNLYALF
jgi:hypothetical protein